MTDEKIQVVEKRDLGLLMAALCMLALAVLLQVTSTVLVVRDSHQVAHEAATAVETHRGVCLYRKSLEDQAKANTQYLLKHPNGVPSLGISAGQIQQGITKERAAVESLSDLHC